MDEPCSALDQVATLAIASLITQLREHCTIVIVTHNLAQAARISDTTGLLTVTGRDQPGRPVESGPADALFAHPVEAAAGRFLGGALDSAG